MSKITKKLLAQDVLGAKPHINTPTYFERFSTNTFDELHQAAAKGDSMPSTADDYITHVESSRINSIASAIGESIQSVGSDDRFAPVLREMDATSQGYFAEKTSKGARLNSAFGEAFDRQLTTVAPFYIEQPIRATSFDFLPKMSIGGISGKKVEFQAVAGAQGKFMRQQERTTTSATIEIDLFKKDVEIFQFGTAISVDMKELAMVGEFEAKNGGSKYSPFVGFMNPIVSKFNYLKAYYKLLHDGLAWYGSETDAAGDNSQFVNIMTSTDIPDYDRNTSLYPGSSFADMDPYVKSNMLVNIFNQLTRQSNGALSGDTLFIDLFSYTLLMEGFSATKDTVPFNNLEANGIRAIIPVPAWSAVAPNQTTIIACRNMPNVWVYNLAAPLFAGNPTLEPYSWSFPWATRSSGMTIVNNLGLVRFTMPLLPSSLTLKKGKKEA